MVKGKPTGAQERKGHLNVLSQALSDFTHKRPLHSNMEGLPSLCTDGHAEARDTDNKDKAEI